MAPPSRKRSPVPLLIGLGGALVVVALVAALFVFDSDEAGAGEIFLEPVAFPGDDPFTDSVDTHNDETTSTTAPVIPPPTRAADAEPVNRRVPGSWPGLYGGTRDESSCDPEGLIGFLDANPAKARAWATVLGLTPEEIPDYVRSLTPVILQRDTRVTNHGFRDGRATPLQSVLQAGTAVLVDDFGVPRVKCGCGNPLLPPAAVSSTPRYTGNRWPSFSPANLVVVTTTDIEITTIVMVDVKGGEPFTRPTGTTGDEDEPLVIDDLCTIFPDDQSCIPDEPPDTEPRGDEPELGTGDVQITLRWYSTADLDLAVTDPTGATISYASPSSPSGGTLDVDSNGGCTSSTATPVENVFWPTGAAPEGEYTVTVDYFDVCEGGEGPQEFELTFLIDGQQATVTPIAMRPSPTDDGYQVTYAVALEADARAAASRPYLRAVNDTLNPGDSATYLVDKGPGFTPSTEGPTTEPDAPDSTPDSTPANPEATDCSQYEEGSMMWILCHHDPTSDVVEGSESLPQPVPQDP